MTLNFDGNLYSLIFLAASRDRFRKLEKVGRGSDDSSYVTERIEEEPETNTGLNLPLLCIS